MYRREGDKVELNFEFIKSLNIKHLKNVEYCEHKHIYNLMKYEDESNVDGICVTDDLYLHLHYINIDEQGNYNCFYHIPRVCDGIVLNKFPQHLTDLANNISICEFIDVQQDNNVFIPLISQQFNICSIKITTKSNVTLDMIPRLISLSTDHYYFSSRCGTRPRFTVAQNKYLFDTNLSYSYDFIRQLYTEGGMMGVIANRLPNSNELKFIKRRQLIHGGQLNTDLYIPKDAKLVYNFSAKLLDNRGNVSDKLNSLQLNDNLNIFIGNDSFPLDEFQSDNALPLNLIYFQEVRVRFNHKSQLNDLIKEGYSLMIEYDEAEYLPPYVRVSNIENDNIVIDNGFVSNCSVQSQL